MGREQRRRDLQTQRVARDGHFRVRVHRPGDARICRRLTECVLRFRGNLQGAISSNVYRANQTPWYPMGHGLVLMYICIGLISTVILRFLLKAENARRERGERDEVIEGYEGGLEVNGRFGSVEEAKKDKGDRWSGYRYTL